LLRNIFSAGDWFLRSGIQETDGGVARHYRTDLRRNSPISTEITGYAAHTLVYLHSLNGDERYLAGAESAARFLACKAWQPETRTMPFEIEPGRYTYFFDCGIVARGLLAVWRATGNDQYLETAAALGAAMVRDFSAPEGDFHPVLELPARQPIERDGARWSRSPGCYQLKSAMAWWELAEATGDKRFRAHYDRVLEQALQTDREFLPGHPDRAKVMDRLHAFAYFLEGLLPRAAEPCCAAALRDGIARMRVLLEEIAPVFERADVYAQLLRIRLYADAAGVVPLDRAAAEDEAHTLRGFQAASGEPQLDGGFYFGRRGSEWLPYVNPVSTAFALQALAQYHGGSGLPLRHLLI